MKLTLILQVKINEQQFTTSFTVLCCYRDLSAFDNIQYTKVILEIEGSIWQRYKRALFPYEKLQKGTSDLSNPYVQSVFTLFLIKQIFQRKI